MFNLIDMLIVRPIVNILFVIYSIVGDFGLAIILFTIIVKFATWPLLKRQMHQTRIMRAIQPELAEIKKNCKGNRQLESLQMMDLYKRKNVKPFRSMLTIFIQIPIFIALYTGINVAVRPFVNDNTIYTVEHSAYSFVEPLNHIKDLISTQQNYFTELTTNQSASYSFKPTLLGVIDLSLTAGLHSLSSIVILIFALFSAFLQFITMRQQDPSRISNQKKRTFKQIMREAAEGKEANQDEINAIAQRQMTSMMPFMMMLIMINLPGALVLYYFLNNLITTFLQKIILDRNYSEMEAAADKRILKELRDIKEAKIVKTPKTTLNQNQSSHFKTPKNKQEKLHITRISASNKKKRR